MNQEQKSIIDTLCQNHTYNYWRIMKRDYTDLYNLIMGHIGNTFPEKLYRFYHQVNPLCKNCGLNPPGFKEFTTGFKDYCSNKCAQRSAEITQKRKDSIIQKYGVEYTGQVDIKKRRTKETCIERYGCSAPAKNISIQEKIRRTFLERYNVDSPSKDPTIRQKQKDSTFKRFGVYYPHQSSEIIDKVMKSRYKLKDFIYPSGRIIKVQGYEPFALRDLMREGFVEEEIITDKSLMPDIWYNHDGTKRRYYPDIYMPKHNKIVEVKSDYTMKADWLKNELKKTACEDLGYDFEYFIYNKNGERL